MISIEDLHELINNMLPKKYPHETVICVHDTENNDLYILDKGNRKIMLTLSTIEEFVEWLIDTRLD